MLRDRRALPEGPGEQPPERLHRDMPLPTSVGRITAILPIVIVLAVSLVAFASAPGLRWASMLAAAPALAAVRYTPRGVLVIGGASVGLATALGMRANPNYDDRPQVIAALVVVTLVSALGSWLRMREERVLAAVRSVSETAQQAVLAPVPPVVGRMRCAVGYNAAAAEASIGGDLYAVVDTVHGVRAVMADVRGKGLPAVRTASLVSGVFREAVFDEPDLLQVVDRIERSLGRDLDTDDFVTAVVVGFPADGGLEIVNCGHQPPLLVHSGQVTVVEPRSPSPPLGLSALTTDRPRRELLSFTAGDRLLLYTDGVTEARDRDGTFYPLADRFVRHLADDPAETLASVQDELIAYVGGRLHDDAAMLLLQRPPR